MKNSQTLTPGHGVALAASLFGAALTIFALGSAYAKYSIASDCKNFNAMVANGQVYECRPKKVDK